MTLLRLTIRKKMLLGYLPLIIVILVLAAYSLTIFRAINTINQSIISNDLQITQTANNLVDHLFAQETYGKRYMVLRSSEMADLFIRRGEEFRSKLGSLRALPEADTSLIAKVDSLHRRFCALYTNSKGQLSKKQEDPVRRQVSFTMVELLRIMSANGEEGRNRKSAQIAEIGRRAFRVLILLSSFGLLLGVGAAVIITRSISQSVTELKKATDRISQGQFDDVTQLKCQDEFGELAAHFRDMGQRLKKLEEMYLDASPLTRLPGGIAVENVLKKRLSGGETVALCMLDLDNFKAFNDRYGYAMGNEVIKATARIVESSVQERGNPDDFVGHVGGDDFSVITRPERHTAICEEIIQRFDAQIANFYNQEDRERKCIVSKNRQGQIMEFPLMSISIAVVTNAKKKDMDHLKMGEVAAELKEYVKTLPGSNYLLDRRN